MKILLLAGVHDIHTVRWANQLYKDGNEVHVSYVSNHKPSIDKFTKGVNLHVLRYPSPYGYYLNVHQLKEIVKKIKPDIINAHYASGYGTLGRLLAFSPFMISVYGSDVYDFPYKNMYNMSLIKKNLRAADAIASTSLVMSHQAAKLAGCSVTDIFITPFGVDIEKFAKRREKKVENEFIIGSIKKLTPKYGIKYGILAVDFLLNKLIPEFGGVQSIKYLIYGEGEEKPELLKLVKEKKLENVIRFEGRIPNDMVPDTLNKIDLFLGTSISDSESFGVAVVEAMACQVPVIVTDVGGFKEVVGDGKAGIVVSRKDYRQMAEEIFKLLFDPDLRERIGLAERRRVVENYDWSKNVEYMEQLYKKLISR